MLGTGCQCLCEATSRRGAALKKQTLMQMCRGVWIPRSCSDGAVLGCCSLSEGKGLPEPPRKEPRGATARGRCSPTSLLEEQSRHRR